MGMGMGKEGWELGDWLVVVVVSWDESREAHM